MEHKIGENLFAYFILLILFVLSVAIGVVFLILLDTFQVTGKVRFLVFLFATVVLFVLMGKFWHDKILNKEQKPPQKSP
ncbi:MAG: hypothetical protein A2173_02325 [Planctomycetes bacterium RBG_13_44_8b]|nr:MAG: hypothetical protein A2173_02325 [Planctomycetes bacterium RBG_13_44_8b]